MKKKPPLYLVVIGLVFVGLCIVLYFIHPLAPLLLLASVLIQGPIVYAITLAKMNGSYQERAYQRQTQYEKDKDAAAWLKQEQQEAASVGFKYWSSRSRCLNALNQAQPLTALGRLEEARVYMDQVEPGKLDKSDRDRFSALQAQWAENAP